VGKQNILDNKTENIRPLSIERVPFLSFVNLVVVETPIMIRSVFRRQPRGAAIHLTIAKRHVHAPVPFNWEDPLDSASLFTEDELAIQETARSYCQERMLPRVLGRSPPLLLLRAPPDFPPHKANRTTTSLTPPQTPTETSTTTRPSSPKWAPSASSAPP